MPKTAEIILDLKSLTATERAIALAIHCLIEENLYPINGQMQNVFEAGRAANITEETSTIAAIQIPVSNTRFRYTTY